MIVWVRLEDGLIHTCMVCTGVGGRETGGWIKGNRMNRGVWDQVIVGVE